MLRRRLVFGGVCFCIEKYLLVGSMVWVFTSLYYEKGEFCSGHVDVLFVWGGFSCRF